MFSCCRYRKFFVFHLDRLYRQLILRLFETIMSLLLKALIGACIVVLIGILSKTRNYYLAGLIPLFPTFALIAHYIVGSERSIQALRVTIVFGLWAIIPYFIYLISLYFFIEHWRLPIALTAAVLCWVIAAWILISAWSQWHS